VVTVVSTEIGMNLFAPLLAAIDIGDIVRIVVIFLIFVVPVIAQALAKLKQIPPPNQRPIPPRPPMDDMANEIEDFLRRAANQQRNPKTPRAARAQQRKIERQAAAEPVQAEVVAEKPVGGQVTEHVKTFLDEEKFAKRGEELGKGVAQTVNQEIDQHLQQVFSHPVSKLAAVSGEAAAPPTAGEPAELAAAAPVVETPNVFADELVAMLTNPDSLRQAILLTEILHRPEERWS